MILNFQFLIPYYIEIHLKKQQLLRKAFEHIIQCKPQNIILEPVKKRWPDNFSLVLRD